MSYIYLVPSTVVVEGHGADEYIVPVYTHSDIFRTSETFGYKCEGLQFTFGCSNGGSNGGGGCAPTILY